MNDEDSFFAANDDDFAWPECSSGESDDDVIEVIMCSVPSSPETNADDKIEENKEVTTNLAGNELNSKSNSTSNDESVKEDEENQEIDGIRGNSAANSLKPEEKSKSEVEEYNKIRANLAGNKQNQKEEQIRVTESSKAKEEESTRPNAAMNCLIEMMKQMYEIDDEKTNQDDIDFVETAKRRGITFPRPRGFDS